MQPLLQWRSSKHYILLVCVCVYIALVIQHAMRMRHFVICVLQLSTEFFHITS